MKKKLITLFCSLTSSFVFAAPHVWHNIEAVNGTWNGTLRAINEENHVWFENVDGEKITGFTITEGGAPKHVGLAFDGQADFDMAYTITLTETTANMTSKSCIFVVTSSAPGQPDITPLSYHGAKCEWKKVGKDMNFFVS